MTRPSGAARPDGPLALHASRPAVPALRVLADDQVGRIHEGALRVLAETGLRVGSAGIRTRLAVAGALVDEARGIVRFPVRLVEEALGAAPAALTLAARDPAWDLDLSSSSGFLSVDGSAAEMLDPQTGLRRPTTLADLGLVTRLAEEMPEIAFLWQSTEAGDVPVAIRPLRELACQLGASRKHVQLMTAVTPGAAAGAVEIARIVAGGAAELRARPILSSFQCSVSPLSFEGPALEAALVYAEAGVPAGFVSMGLTAATAPATVAGTLVLTHAEVVGGIAILQALAPGASTFYGACPTTIDLRTGLVRGGPEDALYQAALAQLGRHLGLVTSIGTFSPGARTSGWQAGMEGGLSIMSSLLSGADLLSGAGLLNGGRVFSLDQLVLDAEAFRIARRFGAGVAAGPDDLAVDIIGAVGPGGHFLAERHTRASMRDLWQPAVFEPGRSWEDWEAAGRPGAGERARERRAALLEGPGAPPLPDGMDEELERVIAARGRAAGIS